MNRRNLMAALVGIGAAAPALLAGGFQRAAERVPLWSLVYREGKDPAAFYADRAEAEAWVESSEEPFEVHPAEFVPTGRYITFRVRTKQVPEFTSPGDVPTHFGSNGYFGDCCSITAGEPTTLAEAVKLMLEHNRDAMASGGDRWAVVAELGEPQGRITDCLECGPHEFGMVSRTQYQPCRLVRA